MRVLLFMLHLCMMRECEGAIVMATLVCGDGGRWGCREKGCEYMGETRGSGFVFTAYDILEMKVVYGVRCVGGVYVLGSG